MEQSGQQPDLEGGQPKKDRRSLRRGLTARLHPGLKAAKPDDALLLEGFIPGKKHRIPYMPVFEDMPKEAWKKEDFMTPRLLEAVMPQRAFEYDHTGKAHYYDHERLLSPKALFFVTGTVFLQKEVLQVVLYMLLLTSSIAVMFATCVPSGRRFDTAGFGYFVVFMKVFISFMLAVFTKMAFSRWWFSVSNFKKFLITIKQFMWLLHSAGIDTKFFELIQRYSISSCYILTSECYSCQHSTRDDGIQRRENTYDWLVEEGFLTTAERQEISTTAEMTGHKLGVATAVIWMWIGELTAQMNKSETIGVKLTGPLHMRLLMLTQACVKTIEDLKTNLAVQVPVGYAHLLAFLVHLNNTLIAISCGLACGSAAAEVVRRHEQMEAQHLSSSVRSDFLGQLYAAGQVMGVQILIVIIEPLLYQSFLQIAHMLMYPFGDETYHIPIERFIHELHVELSVMAKTRLEFAGHHEQMMSQKQREKNEDMEEGDDDGDDDGGGDGDA